VITSRKSHTRFRLVPKSTTLDDSELTLNGIRAQLLAYNTHMFFRANHKNLNEDRPILSRHKCSQCIPVSSNIFMRTFAGIRWEWEWSGWKWRFSLLSLAISSELSHTRPQYYHILICNTYSPWVVLVSLTPKYMTFNGHFALKPVLGSACYGFACSVGFRAKLFWNLQSYANTVSGNM